MSELTLNAKISQAKAKLLIDQPYFGTLASKLELHKSDSLQSFLSDGIRLDYNDEYLSALSLEEIGFVLSNGAMHASLSHENRINNRMSWLWQLSTDYAINAMLVQNMENIPPHINYQSRFDGLYAEEIYAMLKDEISNEEFNDDESNETGFNEQKKKKQQEHQNHDNSESADKNRPGLEFDNVEKKIDNKNEEEQWDQHKDSALDKATAMDEIPLGIERFFTLELESKIDWRAELSNVIDAYYRDDYRMFPPSKKLLYQGIYLPSSFSETMKLIIAIDSSGSIDEFLLSQFLSEVESIMLLFSSYEIDIVVADAKVHQHETFRTGEPLEMEIKGGGGTDFRVVFDFIEDNLDASSLILYFTDTFGIFPEDAPQNEVIWISPKLLPVPFGTLLEIFKE